MERKLLFYQEAGGQDFILLQSLDASLAQEWDCKTVDNLGTFWVGEVVRGTTEHPTHVIIPSILGFPTMVDYGLNRWRVEK